MEDIAKAVGISKPSLYHYFPNKDQLIEEAYKFFSARCRADYMLAWEECGDNYKKKLLILFDKTKLSLNDPDFYGCPFLNASAEITDKKSPVRKVSHAHYKFVVNHLTEFAQHAKLKQPEIVGQKVAALILSGYAAWLVTGSKDSVTNARQTAEIIIREYT